LAAESHVDRSIVSPLDFVYTNVIGTVNLLNTAKEYWKGDLSYEKAHEGGWEKSRDHLFYHISTDEVYGSLGKEGLFKETTAYDPNSPYSASKAASDHLIFAYANTYGIKYIIVRPSNNFGPRQHEEKFLPKMITNLLSGRKIPVYGDGSQVREWTFVKSTANATRFILENSPLNQVYNITSGEFWKNIDVVHRVCEMVQLFALDFIEFVPDRLGHDVRYSIDASKMNSLGYKIQDSFDSCLWETIQSY
jgi:dTDP-glucose 4,6-dehydratase